MQQNKLRSEQKKHGEKHRKWLSSQQQQNAGLHTSTAGVESDDLGAEVESGEVAALPNARPLGPAYTDWLNAGVRDVPEAPPNGSKQEN